MWLPFREVSVAPLTAVRATHAPPPDAPEHHPKGQKAGINSQSVALTRQVWEPQATPTRPGAIWIEPGSVGTGRSSELHALF